ncbi:carbohydrate-binding protein, partial [uncultured Clostridium sp.]|uniref:carbohydrate-binding protein n=1 Tax=uncultured Clostridium sp. TaxID=59620 RepID=UPI002625B46D
MSGITATDKEDGDLTSKIKVTGKVDTSKAGKYTLTYSITDSKGEVTTAKRVVTVTEDDKPEPPTPGEDNFDINKVYNTGDVVIYKGQKYKAKWWTQGAYPDKTDAFEIMVEVNPDGSTPYVPGKTYNGGDKVSYNGKVYVAAWWTNTVPGSDNSWK